MCVREKKKGGKFTVYTWTPLGVRHLVGLFCFTVDRLRAGSICSAFYQWLILSSFALHRVCLWLSREDCGTLGTILCLRGNWAWSRLETPLLVPQSEKPRLQLLPSLQSPVNSSNSGLTRKPDPLYSVHLQEGQTQGKPLIPTP